MTTPATAPANFAEAQDVLAAKLPGYGRRAHQMALAERYEAVLASGGHGLFQAGTGCIQGDAEIIVKRAGISKRMLLRDLVARFNGQRTEQTDSLGRRSVQPKAWDQSIPTYVQREDNGVVRSAHLVGAWCSGVKTTYTVTTSSGRKIRATDEHPFLTERGWLRLDELKIGDEVHVRGSQRGFGRRPKDHDPHNNSSENLVVLGADEHAIYHAEAHAKNNVLYKIIVEDVISIELHGEEMTYDLEVMDSPHNFIANGFVVHNTGKSLAILIPIILSGERVVVATATKALQNQYSGKDLPFLEEHLGVPFTWAVIKGRSNYPCYVKAREIAAPTHGQQQVLDRMEELRGEEAVAALETADREDFPGVPEAEWSAFSMSSTECAGKKSCPFGDVCLAERAKAKAAEAQVVVTNTAYLLTDLNFRSQTEGNVQLLGEIDRVVIDEGHTLGDVATSVLEDNISEGTLVRLGRDMAAYLDRAELDERLGLAVEPAAQALWLALGDLHALFARTTPRTDPMPLSPQQIIGDLGPQFAALYRAIDAAREEINGRRGRDDAQKMARTRILRRSANQLARLKAYTTDPASKTVRWAELEVRKFRGQPVERLYLRSAPVSVAPFLRSALWDAYPTTLMSATLTTGKNRQTGEADFSYLERSVGLEPGEAEAHDAGSPFDYPRQAVLFTPAKGAPEPTGSTVPAWRAYAQAVSAHLVRESGGGALLLFTSRSAMNEAWEGLAAQFEMQGLRCMRQGDAPAGELVRVMKEDGNAVLFALRTFFEGIDIQGAALRLVVIDKLPFTPPTDLVHKARCEAVNAEYNDQWASFDKLMIPEMLLILTQALGRLIRHANDKGVIAILDPRLNSKGYGRKILAALPPARRTTDVEEASAFLRAAR
jgi:ATP-dependent DNA helicase DinG